MTYAYWRGPKAPDGIKEATVVPKRSITAQTSHAASLCSCKEISDSLSMEAIEFAGGNRIREHFECCRKTRR
jgi:hypothetical protein